MVFLLGIHMVLNKVSIKYKCHYHSRLAREKVRTVTRAEKRDRQAGSLAWHSAQTCDENVTIVTKFPFWGGSLGGKCDILERHADPLLRPHFSRYQEILMRRG